MGVEKLNLRRLLEADIDVIQQKKADLTAQLAVATKNFGRIKAELEEKKVTSETLKATRTRLAKKREELEKRASEIQKKAQSLLGGG